MIKNCAELTSDRCEQKTHQNSGCYVSGFRITYFTIMKVKI